MLKNVCGRVKGHWGPAEILWVGMELTPVGSTLSTSTVSTRESLGSKTSVCGPFCFHFSEYYTWPVLRTYLDALYIGVGGSLPGLIANVSPSGQEGLCLFLILLYADKQIKTPPFDGL